MQFDEPRGGCRNVSHLVCIYIIAVRVLNGSLPCPRCEILEEMNAVVGAGGNVLAFRAIDRRNSPRMRSKHVRDAERTQAQEKLRTQKMRVSPS